MIFERKEPIDLSSVDLGMSRSDRLWSALGGLLLGTALVFLLVS